MRRIIQFLLAVFMIFVLAGCTKEGNSSDLQKPDVTPSQITGQIDQRETFQFNDLQIDYSEGTFMWKNWDDPVGTYQGAAIPDRTTALAVATAIFDGKEKTSDQLRYVPCSVFYDTQDKVWIVHFHEPIDPSSSTLTVGGGISIALRESDGAVLRIWAGE